MDRAARNVRNHRRFCDLGLTLALLLAGCDGAHSKSGPAGSAPPRAETSPAAATTPAAVTSARALPTPFVPVKVAVSEEAMGTSLHFVTFTTPELDEAKIRSVIAKSVDEIRRLENVLSEWKPDSEVSQINAHAGQWVTVGPEALEVIGKGLWAGKLSGGSFDITFQALSKIWKFGTAQEDAPRVPSRAEVERLRRLVDYRKVELDEAQHRVRIGKEQQLGLGGIAKGYIVDRTAKVLREGGITSFLTQAGGDLYGAGVKPDGTPWVSGIRDPRGKSEEFFAVLELTDHAFSTAGDYARSYVVDGKRYHHIIDPKTGYPATACRSVTIWAPDATTADGVDDAVFILGPERGLKLVESLDGVGAVIVDEKNRVIVSERVKDRLKVLKPPTDAP
jgi:thiamine biosynthesis lipoprotein